MQSALIKKAEDAEIDTAEQSAIKVRAQQQTSNALVVTDLRPANGLPPSVPAVGPLALVKVPSTSGNAVSPYLLCGCFSYASFFVLGIYNSSTLSYLVFFSP